MSVKRFPVSQAMREASDAEYSCVFRESAAGEPQLDADAITDIVATLLDIRTGGVINEREDQDVLNAHGGTLSSDGAFTFHFDPEDNIIVTPGRVGDYEEHALRLTVTFNRTGGGTGQLHHEVRMFVVNLHGS